MSGIRDKADAASSPESFESARDGVSCANKYNLFVQYRDRHIEYLRDDINLKIYNNI